MAGSTPGRVALLSLHPRFAVAILAGEKTVELRRSAFADDVSHVVVYCTAPVQRVLGWFEVAAIDRDHPQALWKRYRGVAGVSASEFRDYFHGSDRGTAIGVGAVSVLNRPAALEEFGSRTPPQSYRYFEPDHFRKLRRRKTW
jgi:predicted transcriptional regulator